MAINFPDSPTLNDTYTSGNITWTWNGTSWETDTTASSYGDTDVATYLNGGWNFHILPDQNATYDIGSAEYKVRHLYLSDTSLYMGANDVAVNLVNDKLTIGGSHIVESSNTTPVDNTPLDLTRTHHFLTGLCTHTLPDGLYVGQELKLWMSASSGGFDYCDITVLNAKRIQSGTLVTSTNYVWRVTSSGTQAGFNCVWDGTAWILNDGETAA